MPLLVGQRLCGRGWDSASALDTTQLPLTPRSPSKGTGHDILMCSIGVSDRGDSMLRYNFLSRTRNVAICRVTFSIQRGFMGGVLEVVIYGSLQIDFSGDNAQLARYCISRADF